MASSLLKNTSFQNREVRCPEKLPPYLLCDAGIAVGIAAMERPT